MVVMDHLVSSVMFGHLAFMAAGGAIGFIEGLLLCAWKRF